MNQIPEVYDVSPAVLKKDRFNFALALAIPFLGFIAALISLFWRIPNRVDMSLFLLFYCIAAFGLEAGYHRLFSHNAFKTSNTLRVLLAIAGAMAVQGPVSGWVAYHRRHHKFSDKPGDPHSPNLSGSGFYDRAKGLYHAHMGFIFEPYRPNPAFYAKDIFEDPGVFKAMQYYL